MPTIPTRRQQPSPVNPQVPIPGEFPAIPQEVLDRFPTAKEWQTRLNEFWGRTAQAMQEAQRQTAAQVNSTVIWTVDRFLIYTTEGNSMPMFALDDTGIRLGNVLVINTPGRKVYIGAGNYADADTAFYVDTLGNFSLGDSFVWDAETDTLTITGIINATSGTIGGFDIGADYIRDTGNTMGLASTVTGGNDVRFWAGSPFVARSTAAFRVYENGSVAIGDLSTAFSYILLVVSGAITASTTISNIAQTLSVRSDITAAANGNLMTSLGVSSTFNKAGFTGLTSYGIRVASLTSSGAGTIDNAYGVYIDTVSIATNNWGLYVATTARNYMAGDLTVASIGSTTPGTGAFTTLSATGAVVLSTSSGDVGIGTASAFTNAKLGVLGEGWFGDSATRSTSGVGGITIRRAGADTVRYLTMICEGSVTGRVESGGAGDRISTRFANDSSGNYYFETGGTTRLTIATTGITMSSLAGVGTRTVVADANGVLSAP